MTSEEWVSMKEISEELRIPERTLLYYKQKGDFPAVFVFGKSIDEFVEVIMRAGKASI